MSFSGRNFTDSGTCRLIISVSSPIRTISCSLAYGLPVYKSEVGYPDRYLYGGKEFYSLKGINLYDFHARTYAPDECRFWQPDPKADNYHWLSPYSFCGGDPINFTDPDGEKIYYVDMTGRLLSPEEALKANKQPFMEITHSHKRTPEPSHNNKVSTTVRPRRKRKICAPSLLW